MAQTIAVVGAGAMGSAVARRLVQNGCTVLSILDGRSEATRQRAVDAGMKDVSYTSLASQASIVLSILPPSDAFSFASAFYSFAMKVDSKAIFVDCNAVNPVSVKKIAAIFQGSGVGFVDAGIIGGPPKDGYDPTFYYSANSKDSMSQFGELGKLGLKVRALEGGIGSASALKMSYAGISKGTTALLATMVLAAHKESPETAQGLLTELAHSQRALLERFVSTVPPMVPKAYRWVGEMQEIAEFVGGAEGNAYEGISSLFFRVETSRVGDQSDVHALIKFADDARILLNGGR